MLKRIPNRELTSAEVSEILTLKRSDITATLLKKYFACFYGQDASRFQPNDTFTLKKGTYYNKEDIKTTIGRYLYNLLCLPISYLSVYGYLNKPLIADEIGSLEKKMGDLILNDKMTTKEYAYYMDSSEWIAMNTCYYLVPSLGNDNVLPDKSIIKRRDELFDQYSKEIANGDINASNKIEAELLAMAKDKIKKSDDAGFDNFSCGAFKTGVAYKKGSIMIGAIKKSMGDGINIVKSNYIDGTKSSEYGEVSDLTVIGGYSRGVATQDYGYESKKYNSALQNVVVDYSDTNLDCGTTKYLDITINPALKSMFLYRYVLDGLKLVELTNENIDNYVGRPIKLRSPMYCKGDTLCQHCAGTLFKRIDVKNVGLICFNLTGNLMNLSMKKMHDSSVTILKANIDDYITEV